MADSKSDSIISEHFATNRAVIPLQNPLWDYACGVYSQEGVEAALLILQDEHCADINLILQALWLASEGVEWTPECIVGDYGKWVAEQVIPIRALRRHLKTDWVEQRGLVFEDFRQQVKKLELQAEQYALAMLFIASQEFLDRDTNQAPTDLLTSNCELLEKFLGLKPQSLEPLTELVRLTDSKDSFNK